MVICVYYQRNACKYGDNCKNEHPGSQRDRNRGFGGRGGGFGGGSNSNRFGAFGGDSYRPGQQSGTGFGRNTNNPPRYNLDPAIIKTDLTSDRPGYPISCYAPGRDAPRQLIEGPVEVSPEELRSRYYLARISGNERVAQQEQDALASKMDAQVKTILDDLNGAVKYVEDGVDIHPNRIDIATGKAPAAPNISNSNTATSNPFSQQSSTQFGGSAQSQTPAFGQTSTSAFARPATSAFGQPSNPGQSPTMFGQTSNPGQTTSTFGQTSNPGQTTSAFGQPSALGGGSAFGKPSMPGATPFGQPAAPGAFGTATFGKPSMSAFGQTSAPGQQTTFGQPSAPGALSAFGKPSLPGQTAGFGQKNALGQNNAFGKPGFGQSGFLQSSKPGTNISPFGQQQPSNSNPFQSNNQSTPFAQQAPTTTQSNPFGQNQQQAPAQSSQSNPFGGAPAHNTAGTFVLAGGGTASPFATQSSAPAAQNANVFGTKSEASGSSPLASAPQTQPANPFMKPQQTSAPAPFGQQVNANPAAMAGVAANPIEPRDRYKEGSPEEYEGEKGKKLEELYRRIAQTGLFPENEDIPLTPPKCEWIMPV